MWNFFKSIIAAFCDILDLGNKSAPPEKTLPAASSDSGKREIVAKSLPRISWWDKKEAEYWRNRCFMYTNTIFPNLSAYEMAFGNTLAHFFHSHSGWKIIQQFPEIHSYFLAINVYGLKNEWNRRNIPLIEILLGELKQSYVSYVFSKGYDFSGISERLILSIWGIGNTIYLEIPDSLFLINYSQFLPALAPENYWELRQALNKSSKI